MNAPDMQELEQKLRSAGTNLRYPPTPAVASAVMRRLQRPRRRITTGRWTRAAVAVVAALALFLVLMLVPPVRASVLDVIQIGVVRIFRPPTVPPTAVATLTNGAPEMQLPLTATPLVHTSPVGTSTPLVLDIAGETTLAQAQSSIKFRILLPAYPADLGKPDHIYLQSPGASMLMLVWLQPSRSDQVRLSLQEIAPGSWAIGKFNPPTIQDTSVNGRAAVWTAGPYMLEARDHNYVERRLIIGHVLIWKQNSITYRLETDLSMDEAIKIAESMKPVH